MNMKNVSHVLDMVARDYVPDNINLQPAIAAKIEKGKGTTMQPGKQAIVNKKVFAIGTLMIIAIAMIWMVPWFLERGNIFSIREVTPQSKGTKNVSVASWVSQAITVDQLMAEADLVVKARVSEAPKTRVVRHKFPIMDEKGTEIGSKVDELAFSDTVFEVTETYSGKSAAKITVMQTGGSLPESPNSKSEMSDDPLYNVGEEYILFLVDISGDPVQAPGGGELYRIVNPSGRYRIDGKNVSSYAENVDSVQLPATLGELEAQIKKYTQR
jgi:hypothetical protein